VDLVELPVQVDPGDMAQGLRPGDSVQVLAAYTEGARRGCVVVVLLPAAEVVQVFQDPAGLTGAGQDRGVQNIGRLPFCELHTSRGKGRGEQTRRRSHSNYLIVLM
jgi:hypothetical protein